MAEARGSDTSPKPEASGNSADDTIEYEDPDETQEYEEMMATFETYHDDWQEAKDTYHINKIFEEHFDGTPVEQAYEQMYHDLYDEFRELPAITTTSPYDTLFLDHEPIDAHNTLFIDIETLEVFKMDIDTALLTPDDEWRYPHLVREADYRELHSFVIHKVFQPVRKQHLPKGSNVVDCVWVRKWAERGIKVKSRMCARGCFDRQKYFIERHSSTATRLSQRMVVSSALTNMLYNPTGDPNDVTIESFDISTAFLQGMDYQSLQKHARTLGYEYREDRDVFIKPPENVWGHFRKMPDAPASWKIKDHERALWALRCLRAMYGFADAPLMFQLALCDYLKTNGAKASYFDDNYLYWYKHINGEPRLVLLMTIHVDDLQLAGSTFWRTWLHKMLTDRFGELKRQSIPYTHAGIQLEWFSSTCLRLHQDKFCEALDTCTIPKDRLNDPESKCTPTEHKQFRSLTCGALWACQTRLDELYNVVSLQTKLAGPQIKDLIMINTIIKRLKKKHDKFGIYYRHMTGPYRIVVVTDASSANKTSSFATEGIVIGLCPDRLSNIKVDKHDYLDETLVQTLSGEFHVLHASSQKSKRISHSTSHAETLAAAKGIPMGQIIGLRLCEPEVVHTYQVRRPLDLQEMLDAGRLPIPIDAWVDCMDLWELCCGLRGTPQDKSQRLGVLSLREERRTLRLRRLYHIRTSWMLADMLTKSTGVDSRSLLGLITSGCWRVHAPIRVRQGFGK